MAKEMNVVRRLRAALIALGFISFPLLAQQNDQILFDNGAGSLIGSKFGPIACFQRALSDALEKCGKPPTGDTDPPSKNSTS